MVEAVFRAEVFQNELFIFAEHGGCQGLSTIWCKTSAESLDLADVDEEMLLLACNVSFEDLLSQLSFQREANRY